MLTFFDLQTRKEKLCVVGLGYVGLPLAVYLSHHFDVIGFDIKEQRVEELRKGIDRTLEVEENDLKNAPITYSSDPACIRTAKFIIVAVPTPVDNGNLPDLTLVEKATQTVGKFMSKGSVVIYESTVYPGVTEDICLPILEKESGLKGGIDFKIGYSPERVNPGDKEHTIDRVVKVVSGMDEESSKLIAQVYGSITNIFEAANIKVAEAAKVIENTQRDLNIALMNELAVIFSKMNISVYDVLAAAGTKWNFLKFKPGLVGGHCIGVDPYYLTYKAQTMGYHPQVILAGRLINDSMGAWIAKQAVKKILNSGKDPKQAVFVIAGITFKENVTDTRNSKVYDIYKELVSYGIKPVVFDPLADAQEVKHEYGIDLCPVGSVPKADAMIVAVAHNEICDMLKRDLDKYVNKGALVADVKGVMDGEKTVQQGFGYWRL